MSQDRIITCFIYSLNIGIVLGKEISLELGWLVSLLDSVEAVL